MFDKIIYFYKDIQTELEGSKRPHRKLLSFVVYFVLGIAAMYYYKKYEVSNISDQISRNEEESNKKIERIINSSVKTVDSLSKAHINEIIVIKGNFEQQLFDLRNENNVLLNENFKERANYILERANDTRLLPDSITAFFNTLPNDRPLVQISNYTKYPGSTSNYNYQLNSKRNDIITLYFWIHNTSLNDAINPCLSLTAKKANDNLVCFSARLSATNVNSSEFGSAFLSYDSDLKSQVFIKDLFCFKVLNIYIYENKEVTLNKSPFRVYSYPESLCFNLDYNIYTSNIPALVLNNETDDWFVNQYTIVMNILPVYTN